MSLDEEAVICDFAEYYHIYDYKKLPLETVAILVYGLRDYSRIKMKISDSKLSIERHLLAIIADNLRFISWSKTEDALKNQNRPKSILKSLMNNNKDVQPDCTGFANGADFMAAWKEKVTLCQK